MLENHCCARVENTPVTMTASQETDKEDDITHTLTFFVLLSTASSHLRINFIMHTYFYYLNPSIYSPIQLWVSYFS